MYFSQSPAAGGWRPSCEDPCSVGVLAWLEGLSSIYSQVETESGKLFFKMLVHIKHDFLEALSKLLLHFKEGLFIPLV